MGIEWKSCGVVYDDMIEWEKILAKDDEGKENEMLRQFVRVGVGEIRKR